VVFASSGGFVLVERKGEPCIHLNNIVCPHPKRGEFKPLDCRCFRCPHFKQWEKTMEEEDERVTNEIDLIRANPEAYSRGELS
jgi:hypothetical protein